MRQLLQDRFAPITRSIGFLNQPFDVVAAQYVAWRSSHDAHVRRSELSGSFPGMLQQLEPLTMPPIRMLLVATDSPWTAFFDNSIGGSDTTGYCSHLARTLRCRAVSVACHPHVPIRKRADGSYEGSYGAVKLALWGPEDAAFLNIVRAVSAMHNGSRWEFDQVGEPQGFEQAERYTAKRVVDRFTDEMLEQYCAAMGIRVFDEQYYGPAGLLVLVNPQHALRTESLAEVQRALGRAGK